MKAIGMYIFGGSQTLGWLKAGFNVDRVLEMTENMDEANAYHFVRNHPEIPLIKPSVWNNDSYLESLGDYDVLFANPPCSGLSSINRNASADSKVNDHIFEVVNTAMKIKPRVFFIENAPTLTNLGLPILKEIERRVHDDYQLTIINDMAKNHNVAMPRKRTFVIGWRRDHGEMPMIAQELNQDFTVKDAFDGLTNDTPNMIPDPTAHYKELFKYYHLVEQGNSVMRALADTKEELDPEVKKEIDAFRHHRDSKDSIWDKSSYRLSYDSLAPSMSSVAQYMHPTENRDLYVREYARLMGYPDDFIFYEGCKVPYIQCLAQGVPVNFIFYIASEIHRCLTNPSMRAPDDVVYINQTSCLQKITKFTAQEFYECTNIRENKKSQVTLF